MFLLTKPLCLLTNVSTNKNMNLKKISIIITLLVIFGFFLNFNVSEVKAVTAAEIQAQIQALLNQITQLQKQLAEIRGEEEVVWCHDFKVNLRIGDEGDEVSALYIALFKQGLVPERSSAFQRIFDEVVASAVVGFQEKYKEDVLAPWGLEHGTGYVGTTTRAKLNELYGCGVVKPYIKVVSPNGGEKWVIGNTYTISWKSSSSIRGLSIDAFIRPPSKKGYPIFSVAKDEIYSGNTYSWTIPTGIPISPEYKIQINGAIGEEWIPDLSDNYFSIVGRLQRCIGEGEKGSIISNDVCCPGLTQIANSWPADSGCIAPTDGSFICSYCGNGICGKGENICNCLKDCKTTENLPPVIDGLTAPTQLKVNEKGTWTIRAHDPENGVLSYKVDWGDEYLPVAEEILPSEEEAIQTTTFTHSYSKIGDYTIKFTITDDHNQTAETSTTINVVEAIKPYIRVISPNGGEKWRVGNTYEIRWDYSEISDVDSNGLISIRWYDYENQDSYTLVNDYSLFTKSFKLTPTKEFVGNKLKISVIGDILSDESDGYFNVVEKGITIISPKEGEIVIGPKYTVKWKSEGIGTNPIMIQTKDPGEPFSLPNVLELLTPNDGFEEVDIATSRSRKEILTVSGPSPISASVNYIRAAELPPRIIEVVGADDLVFKAGKYNTIKWESLNIPQSNSVSISLEKGNEKYTLAGSTPNDGVKEIFVPTTIPPDAWYTLLIKTQIDGKDIYDKEEVKVERSIPPSITVISPNGGEKWVRGNTYDITWTSAEIEKVTINYVDYSGRPLPKTIVVCTSASLGKYSWRIPDDFPLGNKYKIRISECYSPTIMHEDLSDNYFSIVSAEEVCTDSDGGKEIYVKGYTAIGNNKWIDTCNNPSEVNENYCKDNKAYTDIFSCLDGCQDGACLKVKGGCQVDARNCNLGYTEILCGAIFYEKTWDGYVTRTQKLCKTDEGGGIYSSWSFETPGCATISSTADYCNDLSVVNKGKTTVNDGDFVTYKYCYSNGVWCCPVSNGFHSAWEIYDYGNVTANQIVVDMKTANSYNYGVRIQYSLDKSSWQKFPVSSVIDGTTVDNCSDSCNYVRPINYDTWQEVKLNLSSTTSFRYIRIGRGGGGSFRGNPSVDYLGFSSTKEVTIKHIENQLASIAEAVKQMVERLKELMGR